MKIDKRDDTVEVFFPKDNNGNAPCAFWFPVKAMRRLIPWLPVGAVVQVSNKESSSKATTVRTCFYLNVIRTSQTNFIF
jgi:hypothetical protein